MAICDDPDLRKECRPNRQERFKVAFVVNRQFSSFMCIGIICCCAGCAHATTYFNLLSQVNLQLKKGQAVTDIIIKRDGITHEGDAE